MLCAMKPATITEFNASQSAIDREICDRLQDAISAGLPEADGKIWHAHPVWFLSGNPIVGYSKLKTCIRLMFWSGQSFDLPGLVPEGSFKTACARFTDPAQIDDDLMARWLAASREIQWDYRNIAKRKGHLIRLEPKAK